MPVYWLRDDEISFPHPNEANEEGVLAIGGDLSPERLLFAYANGIFPWYDESNPILWWSPDPRFVLFPEELKVSKSMRPYFNQKKYHCTFDQNFEAVISNCQNIRKGTWITPEMLDAYVYLHELGYAHSVEVWEGENLVGGLYGIALGNVFFGESMFSKKSNASKFGFISLVRYLKEKGFTLIDCQQETGHLASLGGRGIPRTQFLSLLEKNQQHQISPAHWKMPKH